MTRLTAQDFHPEVLKLFDQYVHGGLDRRGFLEHSKKFAVGAMTAEGMLLALTPQFAAAEQVAKTDPRIKGEFVEYASPNGYGKIRGYLVQPASINRKLPVVLVVHENRGLNPHIEDIARRLALDNFIAFAPDALFPLGGYPGDEDKAREAFAKLDQARTREDFLTASRVALGLANGNGKLGVVGFCYGGGIANFLAARVPELNAASSFYGMPPDLADVPKIKASMLIHHAGKDERFLAPWPKYEEALKANGIKYQGFVYPGVEHGFNNDTTPRFDVAAAKLAWQRTLDLFNQTLRT
jgi:carboxymethylenebutenolidase